VNKIQSQFVAAMIVLTGLAIYLAVEATHRREGMAAFTMLVIAAIFWSKVQKKS
jgi:hypothetical protein